MTESESDERRASATERVLQFILDELDAGRLGPGQRVNAAKVAKTLALSAAPVREALAVLAGRGVLDLLPDKGAVMRPLGPAEVCELFEVIAAIASVGAHRAAIAVGRGEPTDGVEAAFAAISTDLGSITPVILFLRLNRYHYALDALGGNRFVTPALERLGLAYWDRYLAKLIDVHANMAGYLCNYRRLHEAVMAGDAGAAVAVTQHHARWSIALVEAMASMAVKPRQRRHRQLAYNH